MKLTRSFLLLICIILLTSVVYAQEPSSPDYYIPHQIYDTKNKQWISLETLLANATQNDVLFLGEQHDDTYGHRLELAIVQGSFRRRPNTVIAMEMFERDAQPSLNNYFSGKISETEFLSQSRPWPNYLSDYRPIIEYARNRKLPVIGSNAPTRLARSVAQNGIEIVSQFPVEARPLVAAQLEYPKDDYWQRFLETMTAMAGHGAAASGQPSPHGNPHGAAPVSDEEVTKRIERFYQAQVLKDETMGESIATIFKDHAKDVTKPFVIHINGDFHSAYGLGTMARAKRRLPDARIKNISFVRVENLDRINVEEYVTQGDYLIFTLGEPENN